MKKKYLLLSSLFILTSCGVINNSDVISDSASSSLDVQPLKEINKNLVKEAPDGFDVFVNTTLNEFQAKFTGEFLKNNNDNTNIAVSPLSLYMALAIAAKCANHKTQEELLSAMGLSKDNINSYISYLFSSSTKFLTDEKGEMACAELLTNSIWFDDEVLLYDTTVEELANYLYTYTYEVNFQEDNTNANKAIREFVKENTKGLIDKDFNLSTETAMALINTLYLKDQWNNFSQDLEYTKNNYNFNNYDNSVTSTKLLSGYYNVGNIVETDSYSHFYTATSNGYKLKFIVPKDGYTVSDIDTEKVFKEVNSIKDYKGIDETKMKKYHTRCLFPEFEASVDASLKDTLKNGFGICDFFTDLICDFTNVTDTAVYCKDVVQKTVLNVDKKGVEGAAVTIMVMDYATSMPPEYEEVYQDFIVDKAFAYELTDAKGVVLFSGIINSI